VGYPASTASDIGAMGEAQMFTDAELEELALAADPNQPIDPDAVPLDVWLGESVDLLPSWYMAPVTARRRLRKGPLFLILLVIATFVAIEAVGLCSTYGQLPIH
jgi:hypothetical protein